MIKKRFAFGPNYTPTAIEGGDGTPVKVLVHGLRRNSVPPEVAKAIIYQIKAYHE